MKLGKKILSLLLAVIMVTTMLTGSLTSLASITVSNSPVTVSIVVPELIYLTPGSSSFQYYIAGAANGVTPSTAASAQGNISFTASRPASSITLTSSGATSVSLSATSASNTASLVSQITAGSKSDSGLITWTFNYVIDGKQYTSTAYTYVYKPYLGQVGAQHGHRYIPLSGNRPSLTAYAFVAGIHTATGGLFDCYYTGTSGYSMSPLVPGWSHANVPLGNEDGYISDEYYPANLNLTGGIASHSRTRSSDTSVEAGSTDTVGTLRVDSSRYAPGTNLSAIPNFKSGFMIHYATNSSETHRLNGFAATNGGLSFTTSSIDYQEDEKAYAYGLYSPIGTVPNATTSYAMKASFSFERNNGAKKVTMDLIFAVAIETINKASLRTAINNAISANYQQKDYTEASYSTYNTAITKACTVLGNPAATSAEVSSAETTLSSAVTKLQKNTYTATVYHKLPATDGFVYNYNGFEYVAENGYVTIIEEKGFMAADAVTVTKESFRGYSFSGEATKTYTDCHADIDHTFTYTAETSVISFNYGSEHLGYIIDGDVKEITVEYGQPYGTFPSPKMDGWRFLGWYDPANSYVSPTTVCTMVKTSLVLTANWKCNFAGGHGSQNDPFLVANAAQLDSLDDASVFSKITDGSLTKGKYFRQTANIDYALSKTPVASFDGNYDGRNFSVNVLESAILSDTVYGSVFGHLNGAFVKDLSVDFRGKLSTTGAGTTYVGIFGYVESSTISDVHITSSGEYAKATGSDGIFAAYVAGDSTISDSSVTLDGGIPCHDAFVGKVADTASFEGINNWVLVNDMVSGVHSHYANVMYVRENLHTVLRFTNGRYTFTATPDDGWTAEYRRADDTLVSGGAVFSPATDVTGAEYYVCAVKNVSFSAGANGTLTGAGTYSLREGQTVEGLVPTPLVGYSFAGWTNGTDGTVNGDGSYTFTMGKTAGNVVADFSVNTYKIIYNGNAGSAQVDVPATAVYSGDKNVNIGPASSRAGYTFKEWNTAPDGSGTVYLPAQQYSALSTENGAEVTLYAIWTPILYTVTFEENGGMAVNDISGVTYGSSVSFPATSKTGYKNLMWYSDATFTGSSHLPGTQKQIYDNAIFYAKWTPVTYTIAFSAEGAIRVPASVEVAYDSGSFVIPANYIPEMPGFTFSNWNTAAGGNGTSYKPLDTIPGNLSAKDGDVITLYAIWETRDFTITWNITNGATINGSTTSPTTTATFGEKYVLPTSVPVKDGYVFKGWFTQMTGGTQITADTVVNVTADTSYYAQWDYATYYVKYDANGGYGEMADSTHQYSVTSALNKNAFVRDGYTFSGWALTKGGSAVYADGVNVTNLTNQHGETVTLYAVWTGKRFSLTYDLNGASGALLPTNVTMDGAAVNLRNYTKTAVAIGDSTYEFYGWALTKELADSMTVAYANNASFVLTEEVLATLTSNLSAATPTITLYAVWARNTTVTWNLTGGTMNGSAESIKTTVTYGEKYVLPVGEPMKIRHSFIGWYTAEAVGAGVEITNESVLLTNEDTTVYAQWTLIGNLESNYITEYYLQNADGTYSDTATSTASATANVGTKVSAVQPAYTGFVFDESNPANIVEGIVTDSLSGEVLVLKVYYARNKYSVTFNANGGEGEMEAVNDYFEKEITLPLNTLTKTGYSFTGWARTADGAVAFADGGAFSITTNNTELFAKWTANKYTVEFIGNGATEGSMVRAQFTYDAPAYLPENTFGKTGANFAGWAVTEGGEAVYEDKAEVINLTSENGGEFKLYAVWTNIEYTVTFDTNGATEGTAPEAQTAVYGQKITLPAGEGLKIVSDSAYRTHLGWYTEAGGVVTEYLVGAVFTAPAENVTLKALWSADYSELNAMTALVKNYRDLQILPANEENDPLYAAGGAMAEDYGFDGTYAWNYFDTEALEAAYIDALKDANKNLPQSQQATVDALADAIEKAIAELTLLDVDYDYRYDCYHYESGFYCDHDDTYYPLCESDFKHSFNSLLTMNLSLDERAVLYTDESLQAYRTAIYGNGLDIKGIYNEVAEAQLKAPVQDKLGDYVDEMARLYHETLVLKDADYTEVDKLITEYLPSLDGVTYDKLINYYTEESVTELQMYYENIDRTHKNVHQDDVDAMYDEIKRLIDALVPYSADYTDIFELIVTIPYGTDGFRYPAAAVTQTTYSEWLAWARENAGNISSAIDMDYLNTRYTVASVSSLNNVLNGIDWTLEIFDQDKINGAGNQSYEVLLRHAIEALAIRNYAISFMMNDGTDMVYDTKYVTYGSAIVYPVANPTRGTDYVFKGWYKDADCTIPVNDEEAVLSDIAFYAKWTLSSDEDITLIAQAGSTTVIDTDRKYIYGLKEGVTVNELDTVYLDVIGNGELEYVYDSVVGTGTKVNLVNSFTGEVIDTYTLVIFGDLNGDGYINTSDKTILNTYISGAVTASFSDVYVYAADLYNDMDITSTDLTQMKSLLSGAATYDQANREIV